MKKNFKAGPKDIFAPHSWKINVAALVKLSS
jgi:hypothetical protein